MSDSASPIVRPSPISARLKSEHAQHLLLLGSFFLVSVAVMLASRHQQSDETSYLRFAHHLADGYYTHKSDPDLWFGPGLPLILAPLVLVGAPLEAMRLLGPFMFTLTVLLFYELLRLHVSPRAALAGAAGLGLYLPFYVLLPSLHSEIQAAFFLVLFMYALTRYLREAQLRYFFVAAIALAWLAVTRIVFGWIILFGLAVWLVAWLVRRQRTRLIVAGLYATALLLCLPWLAYTYSISNNVFYWGSSGGQSLYWMASPYPGQLGDWHSKGAVFREPELAPDRPEFTRIRGLNQIQADARLRHDAATLIRDHPGRYARHLAENLSRILFNMPYSFTPQKLNTLFYIVPNAILLTGLLVATIILWPRRRTLPFEGSVFAVLLLLGVVLQVPLAAYGRMFTPLVPLVLWILVFVLAKYVRLVAGPRPEFSG
jgi:4-amino-4-deoxy-L-arabinose transferase-like glycosyltransferase